MRQRMQGNDSQPDSPPPSGGDPAVPDSSSQTAIIKKSMLGGKQWKPGEEIVFVIKSIDPESGDAEIAYAPEKSKEGSPEEGPEDSMSALDERFPQGGDQSETSMSGGGY